MHWFTAFVLFVIIWWTVLFAVLPFGTRPVESPDGQTGWRGAPERPLIARKMLATTAISAVLNSQFDACCPKKQHPASKARLKRASGGRKHLNGQAEQAHHHGENKDILLVLPCDWRFLPKLGPLRCHAHGPSFLLTREAIPVTRNH